MSKNVPPVTTPDLGIVIVDKSNKKLRELLLKNEDEILNSELDIVLRKAVNDKIVALLDEKKPKD